VTEAAPLLSLRLSVDYRNKAAVLRDVFIELRQGEILGLVGQSGSGKSTLSLAILRLLHLKGGTARGNLSFKGQSLFAKSEAEMRSLRGREMSIVLQSPLSSLNPALRIGTQLSEAWRAHADGTQDECAAAISAGLANVSLPNDSEFLRRRPSQLSVGQAQRVIIAMAILHRPSLLIADEPTSALDTITQSDILRLFAQLNRELGMGILYISHDLLSVAALCHRIAILDAGQILECGSPAQIFGAPQHAYTQKLVAALPRGPFLDFRGDNPGNPIARDENSGCSKRSEESSIPDTESQTVITR
jgi:ABC-type dipeptide/oligopeptide/nickel transport system ATPase component